MKEKLPSSWKLWLLAISCISLIVIIMLHNFSEAIFSRAANHLELDMENMANVNAERISNDLEGVYDIGKTVARIISNQSELEDIQKSLMALTSQTRLVKAIYLQDGENAFDQNGMQIDMTQAGYSQALADYPDSKYVFFSQKGDNSRDFIIMVLPVPSHTSRLLLLYPMERIKNLTNIGTEFSTSTFYTIVDLDGNMLLDVPIESNLTKDGNILENIAYTDTRGVSTAVARITNSLSGCLDVVVEGEKRKLVYSPLDINGWCLIVGVDYHYVEMKEMQEWNETSKVVYQFIGVIVISILVFGVINIAGRIRIMQRNKLLQERMDIDLLTGLNNKLATEGKIREYILENPNCKAMLLILDIDNFKKINDTMGHAFGDEVLRTLGKQISCNFRVTDIVGRVGGDEFIILLKNLKDDETPLREANKLLTFFQGFQVGEYVKYSATASIGAAVYPFDGQSFETLYKSADQALYKAKKRGKNQFAFFDDRDQKVTNVQNAH